MRKIFIGLTIILVACNSNKQNDQVYPENYYRKQAGKILSSYIRDHLECILAKKDAEYNLKNDNIYYLTFPNSKDHFEEFMFNQYGLIYSVIGSQYSCEKKIMDSVILKKFNKDIYKETDSLVQIIYKNIPWYINFDGTYDSNILDEFPEPFIGYEKLDSLLMINILKEDVEQMNCPEDIVNEATFEFTINEKGKIINPRIIKKASPKIDSTIIKNLKRLPILFNPPKYKGKIVKCKRKYSIILK
jgi:hypothetical protein